MRNVFLGILALGIVLATLCANVSAIQPPYFAPTSGPSASMLVGQGTLLGWGRGNWEGTIGISTSRGAEFPLVEGQNTTINGQVVNCYRAPLNGATPDPQECATWPSGFSVGSTNVMYFYWTRVDPYDRQINVTNKLLFGMQMNEYKLHHPNIHIRH